MGWSPPCSGWALLCPLPVHPAPSLSLWRCPPRRWAAGAASFLSQSWTPPQVLLPEAPTGYVSVLISFPWQQPGSLAVTSVLAKRGSRLRKGRRRPQDAQLCEAAPGSDPRGLVGGARRALLSAARPAGEEGSWRPQLEAWAEGPCADRSETKPGTSPRRAPSPGPGPLPGHARGQGPSCLPAHPPALPPPGLPQAGAGSGGCQGLGGWQAGTLGSVSIATSSPRTGFPWGRGCCWLEREALRFPPPPLFMGNNNITPTPGHGAARVTGCFPTHSPSGNRRPDQRARPGHTSFLSPGPEPSSVVWGRQPRTAAQTGGSGGSLPGLNPCAGLWPSG